MYKKQSIYFGYSNTIRAKEMMMNLRQGETG
jgi:hypothetical protein